MGRWFVVTRPPRSSPFGDQLWHLGIIGQYKSHPSTALRKAIARQNPHGKRKLLFISDLHVTEILPELVVQVEMDVDEFCQLTRVQLMHPLDWRERHPAVAFFRRETVFRGDLFLPGYR